MTVEELIDQLKLMPPKSRVRASVDVSTDDDDATLRAFGEEIDDVFAESGEVTICFVGELNDDR